MEIHSSIDSSEELMHYGRKGMKWYQNIFSKDKTGSGRRRGRGDESGDDSDQKSKSSSSGSSSSSGKKDAKDMTEAELMSSIRHLQLEKQYRDLEAQRAAELNPPKVSKGKEFISDFVKKAAVPALQEAGRSVLKDWLVKVGKEAMGLDEKQVEDAGAKLKKEVETLELQKRKTLVEDFYKNRDEKAKKDAEKEAKKEAKKEEDAKRKEAAARKEDDEKSKTNTDDAKTGSSKKNDTDSDPDSNSGSNSGSKKDPKDAFDYYFDGGGKSKTDSGKTFTDDYVERVTGEVVSDNRSVKEKYEQSSGPVYTVDFSPSVVSSGRDYVSETYLIEDKSEE